MPTLLHKSEGLEIVKNDKNGFVVCNLFFWADPAKRSPEWEVEARAGLTDAKFRQEYLIDWEAQSGEKVFPEIVTNKANIVVDPASLEFPDYQVFAAGFDYGSRNPSSFHVYTGYDGITYSVWELFEPCKNIREFSTKLLECPYWSRIKYVAADPHLWDLRGFRDDGNPQSVADQFWAAGVRKFIRGVQDEAAWLATMRNHWADSLNPTFKISASCVNQIREFSAAVFPTLGSGAAAVRNFEERIVDKDNHSLDDCKYFMNSRLRLETKPFKQPNMVKRWLK